jgi:hypothetical protein
MDAVLRSVTNCTGINYFPTFSITRKASELDLILWKTIRACRKRTETNVYSLMAKDGNSIVSKTLLKN